MTRRLLIAILGTFAVAAPATDARSLHVSLTELRDTASAVLVVDVLDSSVRAGAGVMVWTDYRVRLVEVLRGRHRAGDVILLPFAGGRAEGRDVGIAGVPSLKGGARYAIFVDDAPFRPVPAIGWGQGIFEVGPGPLVSMSGAQLELDAGGTIGLAPWTAASGGGRRLPDPVVFDAARGVTPQAGPMRAVMRHSSRPATLRDLRQFVAGAIDERPAAGLR